MILRLLQHTVIERLKCVLELSARLCYLIFIVNFWPSCALILCP